MKKQPARNIRGPKMTTIGALLATTSFAALLGTTARAQSTPPAQPGTPAAATTPTPVAPTAPATTTAQAQAQAPAPAPASAQTPAAATAGAAPAPASDVVGLDRVVVTATSQAKSKMRSSVSVTDIDQEQIKDFAARTEAEVLLLIPGIRTESTAGPGGNANISVRGLPISSGGSKYVQLQEDGLPTVQFGDMNFGNNDYWIRFDNNVDSIQTLRGGSSSVFASHAPGAVLNYISKTGKQAGGGIGLTRGLNFQETRFDGDYGGKLAPDMYYHIGGYYREGEGARHATANALLGYQLKGNLTKEFNGGKGYFRVNFKILDEHAPANPQTYVNAQLNGNTVGSFSRTPGYDGARDSYHSIYNSTVTSIDPVTRQVTNYSLLDGITVKAKSIGFEFHNELANGFTIDNKFRKSDHSGAFQAQFWGPRTLANLLADYAPGTTARYYNGPGAGTTVTAANLGNGLVTADAAINTKLNDMGFLANDLSVSKVWKLDAVTFDTKAGLFHSRQNVDQTWSISNRIVETSKNGRVIDLYDASGVALTTAGLTGYNNQWGGCCARDIDAKFTTDAPYLALNAATGNLDFDIGLRRETFKADGRYAPPRLVGDTNGNGSIDGGETGGLDVNGDGAITGAERTVYYADTANPGLVNYKINYTNYSLGLNYRLTPDLSAFVRHSKGNRAIADRLLYSPNIDRVTGQLAPGGGREAALAPVKQYELGVKHRGNTSFASYGVAATLFHSTTTEFDYDQTRQDDPNLPNYGGPKLNVLGYKASGLELETAAAVGAFSVNVNVVYSKEEITKDLVGTALGNSSVGRTSGGVPKWRYTISPRYTIGDLTFGATVRGQSWVFTGGDNVNRIDGHYIVNAFANYEFGNGFVGSLNVNNLFDKLYPAGGGGFIGGSTTVFNTGVQTGRTISASVRYQF
jgi:outer membrane receptor protein involved in Fe transport